MRIQTAVVLAAGLAALATASTFVPSGQGCLPNGPATGLPFCNTSLPVAVRVADLVSRLVGAERVLAHGPVMWFAAPLTRWASIALIRDFESGAVVEGWR
jgi:hypothetical protein